MRPEHVRTPDIFAAQPTPLRPSIPTYGSPLVDLIELLFFWLR